MMLKKNTVFATFFPGCINLHLTKDVGMIPYVLHRDFGYDSYIICYNNDDFSYLNTEVPGLKLWYMRKGWCRVFEKMVKSFIRERFATRAADAICTFIDTFPFMLKHASKIDILQLYHYKDETIIAAFLYKLFNPRGITYLKLDLHPDVVELCKTDPGKVKSSRLYEIADLDVVSVEYSESLNILKESHPVFKKCADRLYYIPNGIDTAKLSCFRKSYDMKENIVLHVGRIGMHQKASEIVLEAFSRVAREFPSWKLVLIGSMEESFALFYEGFLEKNSDIKDRIQYLGFLESRDDVYKYYGKAKIFFFPSRYESFGLVALEAGCMGDLLLASDIPPVRDITAMGKYGYLCNVDDVECFMKKLKLMMTGMDDEAEMSASFSAFIGKAFDWATICSSLNDIFQEKINSRI